MNKRRILSIFMALGVIVSLVFGTQTEVSAKTQTPLTLKITFNGKSVTLDFARDEKNSQEPKTLDKIEKKLGNKTKTTKEETASLDGGTAYMTTYIWKKGETKISITDNPETGRLRNASVTIKDQNGSIDGIKVGTSETKALKKLKSMYGSNNVSVEKNSISVALQLVFTIKNGKVSKINWQRS